MNTTTDNAQGLRDLAEVIGDTLMCNEPRRFRKWAQTILDFLATHPPQQERAAVRIELPPAMEHRKFREDDPEHYGYVRGWNTLRDVIEGQIAAAPAAPATPDPAARKGWPFVESPGAFAARLEVAIRHFGGVLPAIRNVLIEEPPQFVATPESAEPVGDDHPMVERVARAIAEHGVGSAWDDLAELSAHDICHDDLREYAKAAIGAMNRTPAASDGGLREALYTDEEVAEAMEVLRGRHGSTALITEALDEMERVLLANASNEPPTEQEQPASSVATLAKPSEPVAAPAQESSLRSSAQTKELFAVTYTEAEAMWDAFSEADNMRQGMYSAGNTLLALRAQTTHLNKP